MQLDRRDKWLLTFAMIPIGGVTLFALLIASLYAIVFFIPMSGTVKTATYAARDKQSFQMLDRAYRNSEDLAVLSAASSGRIIELEANTDVRYRPALGQLVSYAASEVRQYFDLQAARPGTGTQKKRALKVKVESGRYKGAVVLIDEQDVGFYGAL